MHARTHAHKAAGCFTPPAPTALHTNPTCDNPPLQRTCARASRRQFRTALIVVRPNLAWQRHALLKPTVLYSTLKTGLFAAALRVWQMGFSLQDMPQLVEDGGQAQGLGWRRPLWLASQKKPQMGLWRAGRGWWVGLGGSHRFWQGRTGRTPDFPHTACAAGGKRFQRGAGALRTRSTQTARPRVGYCGGGGAIAGGQMRAAMERSSRPPWSTAGWHQTQRPDPAPKASAVRGSLVHKKVEGPHKAPNLIDVVLQAAGEAEVVGRAGQPPAGTGCVRVAVVKQAHCAKLAQHSQSLALHQTSTAERHKDPPKAPSSPHLLYVIWSAAVSGNPVSLPSQPSTLSGSTPSKPLAAQAAMRWEGCGGGEDEHLSGTGAASAGAEVAAG